jgi:hypothetical protein
MAVGLMNSTRFHLRGNPSRGNGFHRLMSTLPPCDAHAKRPNDLEHLVIRLCERIVTESEIKAATFSSPFVSLFLPRGGTSPDTGIGDADGRSSVANAISGFRDPELLRVSLLGRNPLTA